MNLTVAICTWNRAALLDQTLTRMRDLRVPAGVGWELLVVDNNSTDDTAAVLARHAAGPLPLRRLAEPEQGLSHARNRAIDHTAGDLLVWTDDDVLVEPDWLAEYVAAAAAFPAAGYFGGTVDPWFEVPPPRWVVRNLDRLEGPFALRRFGPAVRPLADREQVFGANMAFRTPVMKAFRFDPALGRVGTGMLSGDETDVIARARAAGHHGVWVGTARVRHYIPAKRLTARYVWEFFHGLGRTHHRLTPYDRTTPRLLGAPRWLVRKYAVERAKSLALWPCRGDGWIRNFIEAAVTRGIIDEFQAAEPARVALGAGPEESDPWN